MAEWTKERREWVANYEREQQLKENRIAYERYLQTFTDAGRAAPAWEVPPLSFEEWERLLPENELNPELRGSIASFKAFVNKTAIAARDLVAGSRALTDEELQFLGFNTDERVDYPDIQVSTRERKAILHQFARQDDRFNAHLHLQPVTDFLTRNRLAVTLDHFRKAFNLLLGMAVLPAPPEPVALPEPPAPGLNKYGINLEIDRGSPEEQRQKERERYTTEIVVTDPLDGTTYTEYQLDRADAETYRRLVFGELGRPTVRNVISPKR
jgi:hypothetical protein